MKGIHSNRQDPGDRRVNTADKTCNKGWGEQVTADTTTQEDNVWRKKKQMMVECDYSRTRHRKARRLLDVTRYAQFTHMHLNTLSEV